MALAVDLADTWQVSVVIDRPVGDLVIGDETGAAEALLSAFDVVYDGNEVELLDGLDR